MCVCVCVCVCVGECVSWLMNDSPKFHSPVSPQPVEIMKWLTGVGVVSWYVKNGPIPTKSPSPSEIIPSAQSTQKDLNKSQAVRGFWSSARTGPRICFRMTDFILFQPPKDVNEDKIIA